jgi:hypothetical protein
MGDWVDFPRSESPDCRKILWEGNIGQRCVKFHSVIAEKMKMPERRSVMMILLRLLSGLLSCFTTVAFGIIPQSPKVSVHLPGSSCRFAARRSRKRPAGTNR